MKSRTLTCIIAMTLFVALANPRPLAAQEQPNKQRPRYKLVDLGTFGGPASYFSNGADGILNSRGTAVGWADTSTPDPYPAFCFNLDCFVSHAFQWQSGVLTDLGVLPGGASSLSTWISPNGLIAGISQNGEIDPLIPGLPEFRAVLWQKGMMTDLGTLPGGYESQAYAVNNRRQLIGLALNGVPDPFSLVGLGYQARAFLWENQTMGDLGTLGGPDAIAFDLNERGQIAGFSYVNATPNSVSTPCGADIPTVDPFLWGSGTMVDLGTLGGTCGIPSALNNQGKVVGTSDLAGDLTFHPFLWTKAGGMQDLGTLGGGTGLTNWINDAGDIVGKADLPGPLPQNHDAVLWRHGTMIDLGTVPGDSCSNALYVNSRGQVVGTSESRDLCLILTGEHAFLWEDGGPMVDLNSLIPRSSSLQLTYAVTINDRGEIAGFGVPPGCSPTNYTTCGHAYVLIPCREGDESCVDSAERPAAASQSNRASAGYRPSTATQPEPALRGRGILDRLRVRRFPGPG